MKRATLIAIVCMSLLLCSCDSGAHAEIGATEAVYAVTFDSQGGSAVTSQQVRSGCKVAKPEDPTKDCPCKFGGWYYGDEEWSFVGYVVTEDMVLTAKWIDCFGVNERAYVILVGFVENWGYTWEDIVSMEKRDGENTFDYVFKFRDGKTRTGSIYKEYV